MCANEPASEEDASSVEEGLESELQRQLYLFRNQILSEIRHEGRIVQGELRRNRLVLADELETARDRLQATVLSLAARLLRRVNLALITSAGVVVLATLDRHA